MRVRIREPHDCGIDTRLRQDAPGQAGRERRIAASRDFEYLKLGAGADPRCVSAARERPMLSGGNAGLHREHPFDDPMRDNCSSAAAKRMRWSATWVSRARNAPRPVISRPSQPSSHKAAAKSPGSLNADTTLPGISDP